MKIFLVCCLTALLASAVWADEKAPPAAEPFQVMLNRADDRASIEVGKEQTTLRVMSATGIGAATLTRTVKSWPKTVVIEVNLKELEGWTITQNNLRMESGGTWRRVDGEWVAGEIDKRFQPTIKKEAERVLITIPGAWLDDKQPSLTVQWIDYYRR